MTKELSFTHQSSLIGVLSELHLWLLSATRQPHTNLVALVPTHTIISAQSARWIMKVNRQKKALNQMVCLHNYFSMYQMINYTSRILCKNRPRASGPYSPVAALCNQESKIRLCGHMGHALLRAFATPIF